MDWIDLAQNTTQLKALVKTITNHKMLSSRVAAQPAAPTEALSSVN
jgi:hypothetical protein